MLLVGHSPRGAASHSAYLADDRAKTEKRANKRRVENNDVKTPSGHKTEKGGRRVDVNKIIESLEIAKAQLANLTIKGGDSFLMADIISRISEAEDLVQNPKKKVDAKGGKDGAK